MVCNIHAYVYIKIPFEVIVTRDFAQIFWMYSMHNCKCNLLLTFLNKNTKVHAGFIRQITEAKRWNYQDMINKGAVSYKSFKVNKKHHYPYNSETTSTDVAEELTEIQIDEKGDNMSKGPSDKEAKRDKERFVNYLTIFVTINPFTATI